MRFGCSMTICPNELVQLALHEDRAVYQTSHLCRTPASSMLCFGLWIDNGIGFSCHIAGLCNMQEEPTKRSGRMSGSTVALYWPSNDSNAGRGLWLAQRLGMERCTYAVCQWLPHEVYCSQAKGMGMVHCYVMLAW